MYWVHWDQALTSYDEGGLNVESILAFNNALLLKWVWRFVSREGSIWSQIIRQTQVIPNNGLRVKLENGRNTCFRTNNWRGDSPLNIKFNRLYHLDLDGDCKVADRVHNGNWVWIWKRDIGPRNSASLQELIELLGQVSAADGLDRWEWTLTSDGIYSVSYSRSIIDGYLLPTDNIVTR
ncbi:uncharacterized protein [Rutidosis leptorrhynchoides]|uniref:uncharacterized protein n=1 Tax=Rutidosis leptorrhynchoides TaxID=125765 RepID=UPI003A996435